MAEHGLCGLNASGSLTEKDIQCDQCDIQWTSTASASLIPTDSGARDLLSELKRVLDASGIHALRECMAALQDSMMNMEMLVAAQASKMGEMASVMQTLAKEPLAKETKTRTVSHLSLRVSAPSSPVSKPEPQQVSAPGRPSQDPILLPTAIPNAMPMGPTGPTGPQNHPSRSSQDSRPHASGDSESEKPPPKNLGSFHSRRSGKSPGSSFGLDAFLGKVRSPMLGIANLEDLQASQLLQSMRRPSRRKNTGARRCSRQSEDLPRSSSHRAVKIVEKNPQTDCGTLLEPALRVEPHPSDSSLLPNGKKKAHTMNSRPRGEDKAAVLEKCQRVSMEELRTNYDAVIAEFSVNKVSERRGDGEVSALPRVGRCLLCMAGHLRFSEGLASRCFAILSFGIIPMAMSGLLLYGGAVSLMDTSLLLALTSFQLGVSVASFSFDRKGIALLLGPEETRLDDYAREADFVADWQKVSRKRFIETVCMFIGMMCARIAAQIWVRGQLELEANWDQVYTIAFTFMLFRYLLLCYSILHCCCGLELALDSFGVRFFREMDIEQALSEWNTLQATLRQASTKISDSLLVIGFCCLASMALLGEQVIRNPRSFVETPGQMTSWLSRYYPLMIAFLYTMMRAAAITEKANRVAPLVNSWKFHKSHQEDDERGVWMDYERQYVVQYISQSRAGFFIRGSQLTVPTVQKLLYYLGAVSFALFSRLSAV